MCVCSGNYFEQCIVHIAFCSLNCFIIIIIYTENKGWHLIVFFSDNSSLKYAYIILTPLNATFI